MATNEVNLYLGHDLGGRYTVESFLASGGFCLVFQGTDASSNRPVALKILSQAASTEGRVEFETEKDLLTALARASHVIEILDGASDQIDVVVQGTGASVHVPVHFLVLELADACLTELVLTRGNVSWTDRLKMFRDVVKGVHQMHLAAMVHRDIKSENVLVLLGKRNLVTAKVADLGRSRLTSETARFTPDDYAAGRGDLRFAAPELLWLLGLDEPDFWRRVDLYLLGSVLFELATGQGLTSMALVNPFSYLQRASGLDSGAREADFTNEIANLRSRYQFAFQLFQQELPGPIRQEGVRLIRTLCDPDPRKRVALFRPVKMTNPWSLEWLLRRVDIMVKQLEVQPRRG